MEFIVISGLSGAGKSQAASILEDIGYFVVDNMPPSLIPKFVELQLAGPVHGEERVAVVCDIRGGQTFEGLFSALGDLEKAGCPYQILFMEATSETIIKRYKETRHLHPLAKNGRSLEEAVQMERTILTPVREKASFLVDTTAYTLGQLRGEMLRLFGQEDTRQSMSVTVMSFGFKHGIPLEADLVFDVRFLPNPYYIAELRDKTGLDQEVYDFVFGYQQTRDFMNYLTQLMAFLLPHYVEEGKTNLVVGIGCTGGRHRSVAVTRALADFVRQKGYNAGETHRDMTRAR